MYAEASIEEDMAKRIMLSIIPALNTPAELHHTGGFDQKALRSAVHGAVDVIKYGTAVCVDEMEYYSSRYLVGIKRIKDMGSGFITDRTKQEMADLQAKRDKCKAILHNAKAKLSSGDYGEALALCIKGFRDREAWENSFGGHNWANIAETVYRINASWRELQNLRREAREPKTTSSRQDFDYVAAENTTMRNIIVYLNVFDGLAHNTGSVMPKVLNKEHGISGDDFELPGEQRDYIDRVKNMMDAKELNDPLEVYKQVEHIIDNGPSKYLFRDWIKRMKSNPGYGGSLDPEQRRAAMEKIRAKKALISGFEGLKRTAYSIKAKLNDLKTGTEINIVRYYTNVIDMLYAMSRDISFFYNAVFDYRIEPSPLHSTSRVFDKGETDKLAFAISDLEREMHVVDSSGIMYKEVAFDDIKYVKTHTSILEVDVNRLLTATMKVQHALEEL